MILVNFTLRMSSIHDERGIWTQGIWTHALLNGNLKSSALDQLGHLIRWLYSRKFQLGYLQAEALWFLTKTFTCS